jgi:hypothetical protein
MRAEVLAYLQANAVTGFPISTELPWDANGVPLYRKNFRRVYVGPDQVSQEPLIDTLNGSGVIDEITTVSVYVATDAKNLPTGYSDLVTMITGARLVTTLTGATQRVTQVSTSFEQDSQITEFDISFRRLIVNS